MDVQALLASLKKNPEAVKNSEYFRELLDDSETADSEDLRSFVEELVKKPEFGTRAEAPEEEKE